MKLLVIAALFGVLHGSASADKPESSASTGSAGARSDAQRRGVSIEHFARGKRAYAAGEFAKAIGEFDLAYQAFPAPEYLQNIAQAFRRLDRCPEALAYFAQFLAARPDAPNRKAVEAQIATLQLRCPPAGPPPVPPDPVVAAPMTPLSLPPAPAPRVAALEPPTTLVATVPALADRAAPATWSAEATAGVLVLGAGPVHVPPVVEARVGARYRVGTAADLHVGIALDLARLPYDDVMSGTLWLGGPQATVDGALPITSRLSIIGGGGVGARVAWGLRAGNPFAEAGLASSAIAMLLVRAEVGVAWRASPRVTIRVLPLAVQYSPRRAPLAADIGSLHAFAMLAGFDVDL